MRGRVLTVNVKTFYVLNERKTANSPSSKIADKLRKFLNSTQFHCGAYFEKTRKKFIVHTERFC